MIESHSPGEMSLSKHYHFLAILIAAYDTETITRWLGEKAKQWDALLRFHFSFIERKHISQKELSCLATDFDGTLIFLLWSSKQQQQHWKSKTRWHKSTVPPINLSSLINCVGAAVFFMLFNLLTCWQFDPSPTTMTKTLPRTSGVLCGDSSRRPQQLWVVSCHKQQIVYVFHHTVWV